MMRGDNWQHTVARGRMAHRQAIGIAVRERRRHHRFNLHGRVRLELGDRQFEFPAADISTSGIGVLLDAAVLGGKPSGAVGHCIIESPELSGTVDAYVSIMRMRRLGEQILVGLRFESISDEQLQIIRDFEARGRQGRGAHPG